MIGEMGGIRSVPFVEYNMHGADGAKQFFSISFS